MVTALPQLWRHALRSTSNSAWVTVRSSPRVTVRSSPTPNVHRGERRYHVKSFKSSDFKHFNNTSSFSERSCFLSAWKLASIRDFSADNVAREFIRVVSWVRKWSTFSSLWLVFCAAKEAWKQYLLCKFACEKVKYGMLQWGHRMINKILDAYYSVLLSQVEVLVVCHHLNFCDGWKSTRESMLNGAVNSLREMWERMIHVTSIRGLSAASTFNK